jgi:putative methyltransferase (TIGR04325 family)
MNKTIKYFIPPAAYVCYDRFVKNMGYFGNYLTWQEADKDSLGYAADQILDQVKGALLKVKNGEAAYERDSVLFDEIQYSWPLLAGLLWISSRNGNRLNLLDFGGSLGSSYYQNRELLLHLNELSWNVVEQDKFVRCGREFFEDQKLKFYFTIEECMEACRIDAILLSGVLPYMEEPYKLLEQVRKQKIKYIVIDRTLTMDGDKDRLTVQHVPAKIYGARYPAWILGREKLLKMFEEDYEMVMHFDALAGSVFLGDTFAHDKGFVFRIKS